MMSFTTTWTGNWRPSAFEEEKARRDFKPKTTRGPKISTRTFRLRVNRLTAETHLLPVACLFPPPDANFSAQVPAISRFPLGVSAFVFRSWPVHLMQKSSPSRVEQAQEDYLVHFADGVADLELRAPSSMLYPETKGGRTLT